MTTRHSPRHVSPVAVSRLASRLGLFLLTLRSWIERPAAPRYRVVLRIDEFEELVEVSVPGGQ